MNRKVFAAVALVSVVAGFGCVDQDAPLILGNIRGFDPENNCGAADFDTFRPIAGHLDVAGTTRYTHWVEIASQLGPVSRETGEGVEEETSPNEAIVNRVNLTYESVGDGAPAMAEESYPVHFIIQPGTGFDDNVLRVEFFPPIAAETLKTVPANAQFTLYVTVTVSGKLRSGARFESAGLTLPITVINSGLTCADGETVGLTSYCGLPGGIDGAPVVCCPEANPFCATPSPE